MHSPVYNITPFTLLDYPDKTACIIWFAGCNMRCTYCYNPELIEGTGKISFDEVVAFLKTRLGLIDGVVLSGGECTRYVELINFVRKIRDLGMKVKIDTNGTNPKMLDFLIKEGLIDYVALDYKAPKERFFEITKSKLFEKFEKSLDHLIQSNVEFEVRTTVHSDLLSKDNLFQMVGYLTHRGYNGTFYIQQFINDIPTLGNLGYSKNYLISEDFVNSEVKVVIRN